MLWLRNPVLEDFDQAYENIFSTDAYHCLGNDKGLLTPTRVPVASQLEQ